VCVWLLFEFPPQSIQQLEHKPVIAYHITMIVRMPLQLVCFTLLQPNPAQVFVLAPAAPMSGVWECSPGLLPCATAPARARPAGANVALLWENTQSCEEEGWWMRCPIPESPRFLLVEKPMLHSDDGRLNEQQDCVELCVCC